MSSATVIACPSCGTKNRVPDAPTGVPRCASCKGALPWVVEARAADFESIVSSSSMPVVVDLWAPWCGPCRMVSPLLEQLAGELAGRVRVVKVNVDEAPSVQARFAIRGIPTLVLLRDGAEIDRLVGAHPLHELRSWVQRGIGAVG